MASLDSRNQPEGEGKWSPPNFKSLTHGTQFTPRTPRPETLGNARVEGSGLQSAGGAPEENGPEQERASPQSGHTLSHMLLAVGQGDHMEV